MTKKRPKDDHSSEENNTVHVAGCCPTSARETVQSEKKTQERGAFPSADKFYLKSKAEPDEGGVPRKRVNTVYLIHMGIQESLVVFTLPHLGSALSSSSEHYPLKMRCQSCALVTSSGHLLGSKLGNKIDQTECVIRMNDAPTRGYGQDVGNKTSLRVIAHSSIQRILRNRNELLNMSQGTVFVFWGPSSYMRRDGKGLVFNNLQLINKILPRLKVHTITRHKMLQFDELFKKETGKDRKISNTWLSTGWFTMSIALELCNTINVYGMVPPDFCRSPNHTSVPYHYYEPMGPDECTMYISHERGRKGSHHRFITEKKVFADWARTFNINFFQPDWKPEAHTGKHLLVKPMF